MKVTVSLLKYCLLSLAVFCSLTLWSFPLPFWAACSVSLWFAAGMIGADVLLPVELFDGSRDPLFLRVPTIIGISIYGMWALAIGYILLHQDDRVVESKKQPKTVQEMPMVLATSSQLA